MRCERLFILLSAGLLGIATVTPAVAAPGDSATEGVGTASVGSPATIVSPGCNFAEASADAVPAASGANSSRGFASFGGDNCPRPLWSGRLTYFAGAGPPWFTQVTPYYGRVLAASNDSTGTWVLFSTASGIYLGKRTMTGTFATPARLSTHGNGGAVLPSGDLVTEGGRYWAVWTEQVGPGGEFAQTDIFQAKTIGVGQCLSAPITRRQVTFLTRHDDSPTLVLVPAAAGASGAHIAWSRNDGARGESGWLMYGTADCTAQWGSFQNLNAVGGNYEPDLTRLGTTDYLAWTHDSLSHQGSFPITGRVPPNGIFDGVSFGGGLQSDSTHLAVANADTVLVLTRTSDGRLGAWKGANLGWGFEYLTSAGLQQQAEAVTTYGGAFTTFGISFASDRLYSIQVTIP